MQASNSVRRTGVAGGELYQLNNITPALGKFTVDKTIIDCYNKNTVVILRKLFKRRKTMPRNFLFTKEQILNAALDLTREKGFAAVSARALGAKLGTSSQPIFGYFENMAAVQNGIIEAAGKLYRSYLNEDMASGKYPPYKASGMAYIRFAREEKELFKLLFMRDRTEEEKATVAPEADMLLDLICKQVNITRDSARLFYLEMWAYVHGIATMLATGYFDWSEELCSQSLTDMYRGLKYKYENSIPNRGL